MSCRAGLPINNNNNNIKAELLSLGFDVRNVHNIKSSVTKESLSMFLIDLDPKPNNSEM